MSGMRPVRKNCSMSGVWSIGGMKSDRRVGLREFYLGYGGGYEPASSERDFIVMKICSLAAAFLNVTKSLCCRLYGGWEGPMVTLLMTSQDNSAVILFLWRFSYVLSKHLPLHWRCSWQSAMWHAARWWVLLVSWWRRKESRHIRM